MSFLAEFKSFATRGNVVDLSTAVVIGTAFGKIVASLVDGIIMPMMGLFLNGIDVSDRSLDIGQVSVKWGMFLQSIINFLIIAFVIFCLIKIINRIENKKTRDFKQEQHDASQTKLLAEIRDILKRERQTQ